MPSETTQVIIIILALYGLACLIGTFIDYLINGSRFNKQKYELILSVKNQQDSIEDVVHSIFKDELFKNSGPECKVVVIDKGSSDDTVKILRKLSCQYENLEVILEKDNV